MPLKGSNMTKASPSTLKNLDLTDEDWSSHPAIVWLTKYKKLLLWIFLGLVILLIAATRFAAMRTLDAEQDYFQAQASFTQFQKDYGNHKDLGDLTQLNEIMNRHPEIKPKYQGPLAQTLLISGQIPQAEKFADEVFKRTQPDYLQLYRHYSQISLLIGEDKFEEALSQTKKLKETLNQLGVNETPLLYIYNLMRLALLYQQTGQTKEELAVWDELEMQPERIEAVIATNRVLKIGQASLNQYIEQRKKELNK